MACVNYSKYPDVMIFDVSMFKSTS